MEPAMAGRLLMEFRRMAGEPPASHLSGLSEREREIMDALSAGATNREIAAQLRLAEQTVKNSLSAIYHKLGVTNRVEAASAYRRLAGSHGRHGGT